MAQNLQPIIILFIACFGISTSIVLAKTDSQDVSALNDAYKNLNSPSKLNGWSSNGGDPCGDSWDGITCKGSSVTEIKVSGRGLSGSLGYQLEKLRSLSYLDVSKNNLNGNLPYQLPQNLVYLDGSENDFNGNVPYSVSLMNDLKYLNLAKNNLNGELSDMFQKLPKLETIDLSGNQLTGKLPQSFANLTSLKTLHLQENQLKGSINSLRDLPKIDDVNVANNQFTGWIPNELKNIGNLETQGNQWSTGRAPSPPPGTRHIDRNSEGGGGGDNKTLITGIIIAVSVIGGLILFAGLIALFSRRRNSHPSSHFFDEEKEGGTNRSKPLFTPQTSQILHFETMEEFKGEKNVDSTETKPYVRRTTSVSFKNAPTFHLIPCNQVVTRCESSGDCPDTRGVKAFALIDLQNSASGFSPNRLIGEGTIGRVYKAKYQDGKKFAVKEIESSLLGNPEEFSHMVSSISSIHHPNMAELVGYCSEQGRNMLVYEYYTSGSLHKFLHLSDDFSNPLTWNTRIRIALGTAQAIEHLHACSPPLIHKNIKSSNVLLDSELTPHLSDYGMANFHHRTSQNLGVGYNAPECTDPSAYTLKSDVYSLGVVMLELLTGRTPYDSDRKKQEQSLVRWAKPQLKDMDALMEMADPALCGLFAPESVSSFADIVSTCVMAEPQLRPEVSNVVEALKRLV